MNRSSLIIALLLTPALLHCSSGGGMTTLPEPGHGALAIEIVPNPIVAKRVSGDTYDFPFDVRVSNPGSLAVTIRRVQIDVTALGGVTIASESVSAEEIRSRGYPTVVEAGETLSYHFAPRKEVPDDRLFGGVSAVLTVSGADSAGKPVSASLEVSVTR